MVGNIFLLVCKMFHMSVAMRSDMCRNMCEIAIRMEWHQECNRFGMMHIQWQRVMLVAALGSTFVVALLAWMV